PVQPTGAMRFSAHRDGAPPRRPRARARRPADASPGRFRRPRHRPPSRITLAPPSKSRPQEAAMLKVWGRVNSINVQKVLWALAELDVRYERTDAGMAFGVVNEPFYQKMNPNARVPTIDDDGVVLWESNAIVRYLAAKHGAGGLWPTELAVRADSDRWMDWVSNHVG